MEIKSVALLGAGAVGSYIIWGLSKLPDIRFGIIAEGSRAARLRDEGCSINNIKKIAERTQIIETGVEELVNARKVANKIENEHDKAIAYHDTVKYEHGLDAPAQKVHLFGCLFWHHE